MNRKNTNGFFPKETLKITEQSGRKKDKNSELFTFQPIYDGLHFSVTHRGRLMKKFGHTVDVYKCFVKKKNRGNPQFRRMWGNCTATLYRRCEDGFYKVEGVHCKLCHMITKEGNNSDSSSSKTDGLQTEVRTSNSSIARESNSNLDSSTISTSHDQYFGQMRVSPNDASQVFSLSQVLKRRRIRGAVQVPSCSESCYYHFDSVISIMDIRRKVVKSGEWVFMTVYYPCTYIRLSPFYDGDLVKIVLICKNGDTETIRWDPLGASEFRFRLTDNLHNYDQGANILMEFMVPCDFKYEGLVDVEVVFERFGQRKRKENAFRIIARANSTDENLQAQNFNNNYNSVSSDKEKFGYFFKEDADELDIGMNEEDEEEEEEEEEVEIEEEEDSFNFLENDNLIFFGDEDHMFDNMYDF